ncbi:MAG: flagellar hook-basal body complex protein FliE [Leptothrix sp. (in: b-proteobacteria)]
MDIQLKPFDFTQAATRAGMPQVAQRVRDSAQAAGLSGTGGVGGAAAVDKGGFSQVLTQAIRGVSDTQNQAQALQREVSLDNPTVSIEQTMISMQRAQLSFQTALQVRNRMVQAYSDIMAIQV